MTKIPFYCSFYLLLACINFCQASGVLYTKSFERVQPNSAPDSISFYLIGGLHKIDLTDNTAILIEPVENSANNFQDISDDQSSIIFRDRTKYSQHSLGMSIRPQPLIIKNFYSYDTLSHSGINARFTINDDIICYIDHTNEAVFNTIDKYNINISSISQDYSLTLGEDIYGKFYMLSFDKNRIMWFDKIDGENTLGIFTYNISTRQTILLNANLSTEEFDFHPGSHIVNTSGNFFWGKNNILYASLKNSNGIQSLFSLDISQNPDSFTEILTLDTDLSLIKTDDFGHEKFLFYTTIDSSNKEYWAYDIINDTYEYMFNHSYNNMLYMSDFEQRPTYYTWSSDTTKAYISMSSFCWYFCVDPINILEYNFSSGLLDFLPNVFAPDGRFFYFENSMNDVPSDVVLNHPLQDETLVFNQLNIADSTTFSWTSSQDADNDSLSYTFILYDNDVDSINNPHFSRPGIPRQLLTLNTSDTSIKISNNLLYDTFMESFSDSVSLLSWGVNVYDGHHRNRMDYDSTFSINVSYLETVNQNWHVSTVGSDNSGNGSLNLPFGTIQKAIDVAIDGDSVFVSAGTYVENINFIGKNIAVIGENRETTIIDGNQNGSVAKFVGGEDENAIIKGFTLKNGLGSDLFIITNIPETVSLDTTILSGYGGGIQLYNSSPKIEDLIIKNNKAIYGGGISLFRSDAHIHNVLILENEVRPEPGVLGAIAGGGGLSLGGSSPHISHCTIANNSAYGTAFGGGLFSNYVSSSLTISNSNFINNFGIINEIFAVTDSAGGGIFYSGPLNIKNSIIYNDLDFDEYASSDYREDVLGDHNITYSFVSGGYEGQGNLDTIPLFCDLENGDFTLFDNSPLLGSGENGSTIGAFGIGCISETVSIRAENIFPEKFALHQNYPNPFNPITTLRYDLPEIGFVDITIYDMMGRAVKTLVNSTQTPGFKLVQWNGTNNNNEQVSAGLYVYTIQVGMFRETKKMVFLK